MMLDANPSKNSSPADHALPLKHYKTPHYLLQGGSHGLQDISRLCPPLSGKAIKAILFYFTQNAVSVFLFSTREQRL